MRCTNLALIVPKKRKLAFYNFFLIEILPKNFGELYFYQPAVESIEMKITGNFLAVGGM